MLRHSFAAALATLSRDRFYTGVIIVGLAVGFAAAMLIGLYVHGEYSFERFIPGYEQVYRLETDRLVAGGERQPTDVAVSTAVGRVALDFPEVEHVARLERSTRWVGTGEAKSRERVAWVDPDFFDVLPFPVLAGDAVAALHVPDSVVVTQAMARKHFGEDAPIGKTLLVQSPAGPDPSAHAMVVRAVLKDPPYGTHLEQFKIFASWRAAWSPSVAYDRTPGPYIVWSYVRLRPGVPADEVSARLPAFAARHYPNAQFRLEAIKDLHFTGDDRAVIAGIGAVGALIIVIAGINFVTLITARGTRRAVEVGVRKFVGARRRDVIIQFIGEALIYVLLALGISVALVKLALPLANILLGRTITFDLMADPALAAVIAATALLTGLIAGLYPAVVLSSFRTASALKEGSSLLMGSAKVRQALVVVQFAILTGLVIVAATISRQTAFVLQNFVRLNQDQVLTINTPCERAFKQELAMTPGVDAVSCASNRAVSVSEFSFRAPVRGSVNAITDVIAVPIDVGFLQMHGLQPLAGRFFSEDFGQDMVLDRSSPDSEGQPTVVLNESGVRQLGFTSPATAVGSSLVWARPSFAAVTDSPAFRSSQIVGVVPDFTLGSLRDAIQPTMYFVDPPNTEIVFAKLEESRLPETLRAIDDLWHRTGHARPIFREFLGEALRPMYDDVIVQGRIIAASTGLAILIACLGLFALAVFTTARRTKEIGVRKAVGASSLDVVRLFLWRFTQPVLWANVIAWPLAFWVASHWLNGFAYRVSLPLWLFLAASASALTIAWATVGTQSWLAAQAKPATTLRYE